MFLKSGRVLPGRMRLTINAMLVRPRILRMTFRWLRLLVVLVVAAAFAPAGASAQEPAPSDLVAAQQKVLQALAAQDRDAFIEAETAKWGKVIRDAKVTLDEYAAPFARMLAMIFTSSCAVTAIKMSQSATPASCWIS